jgi:NAD(P)-dependent dehydrogenase (short-subunit alcohol dehydrogenase family)
VTGSGGTHSGRTAVVTGAARGLGQVIAVGLAQRGARIVAVDLRSCEETAAQIKEAGGSCTSFQADVGSPEDVGRLAEEVHADVGPVTILVNNAGIAKYTLFPDVTYEEWREVVTNNLDSQFLVSRVFAPDMIEAKWGRIVNVSSSVIYTAGTSLSAYMSSKHGSLGLTNALANDLGGYGITVNAVSPAPTRTPMMDEAIEAGVLTAERLQRGAQAQAIKEPGKPEDMLGAVLFLSSDEASFITAQFLVADGGLSRR